MTKLNGDQITTCITEWPSAKKDNVRPDLQHICYPPADNFTYYMEDWEYIEDESENLGWDIEQCKNWKKLFTNETMEDRGRHSKKNYLIF